KQTKDKRQEIIWEWEELPGFVAGLGLEKFLLEELARARATVKRRDEALSASTLVVFHTPLQFLLRGDRDITKTALFFPPRCHS
ncbi:hypothetical protein KIL84_009449, partial [Mauremys mutica]